jgi:PKD domain
MAYERVQRIRVAALAAALGVWVGGCTMHEAEAPPITGPSVFATSLEMTASPDVLPEDGTSRSIITIQARNENGQPLPNLGIRMIAEFGSLSAGQVTTGSDGRASIVFTAPMTPFPGLDTGRIADIVAMPIGNNFDNSNTFKVAIRLVPPAVIQVPGAPVAAFTFGPPNPKAGDVVLFDASASFDPDGNIVSYDWDWGDGDLHGSGKNQDHDYAASGTYFVTLTVTDNSGIKSSVTRVIQVSGS